MAMQIIRDEETAGLFMIPLWTSWGIKRCNIKGCKNKPTTIYIGDFLSIAACHTEQYRLGICETHHKKFESEGKIYGEFVFDDFDAFKQGEDDGQ